MNDREIRSTHAKITDLLSVSRLKEALDLMTSLVSETGMGKWLREKEELDTTYKYMLKYTVEGIKDPERDRVYKKMMARAFELADQTKENLLTRHSADYLYVQKRILNNEAIDFSLNPANLTGVNPATYNNEMSVLFRYFWLRDEYIDEEIKLFKGVFEEGFVDIGEQAALVSAINLSAWRYFDEEKLNLLFDLYESEYDEIRQRALVGLVVSFYQYDARLHFYPKIRSRFLVLDESEGFKTLVEEIMVQMIRSKDTEKLTKMMQEEILPEMMKLTPHLRKKLDLDKLLKESLGEDQNPEWEEILDETPELRGKVEELTELQMEGSDVFMSSFSMLKHFPFFKPIFNWFMPFSPDHPDIRLLNEKNQEDWFKKFMEAIEGSSFMCNSDKYSFCYGIQSMPDDMKKFLSDGLKAESDQLTELMKDEEIMDSNKKAKTIIRQYAQDLYRFFKLFSDRNSFDDLYGWPLDFHNKSFFHDLFRGEDSILFTLAGFYFKKKYYREAAEVYNILEQSGNSTVEVLQKIGYAWQQQGNFEEALKFYLKADIIQPENLWNQRKIALCYRFLKQPDKALPYFRQAEHLDPDNLNTEVSIGHCLLDLELFEEALKSYFKVEYLDPDNYKVWRPIAWCSFVLGKFDQARKYYAKLMDRKPNQFDYLNMGHVEWCTGNRQVAVELYKKSILLKESDLESFMESFRDDEEYLLKFGVDPAEIPIVLDHLRYSLE